MKVASALKSGVLAPKLQLAQFSDSLLQRGGETLHIA
jgi:hypothetical protein